MRLDLTLMPNGFSVRKYENVQCWRRHHWLRAVWFLLFLTVSRWIMKLKPQETSKYAVDAGCSFARIGMFAAVSIVCRHESQLQCSDWQNVWHHMARMNFNFFYTFHVHTWGSAAIDAIDKKEEKRKIKCYTPNSIHWMPYKIRRSRIYPNVRMMYLGSGLSAAQIKIHIYLSAFEYIDDWSPIESFE